MTEIKTLENKVRIVAEKITNVRSATIGIFIASGSRHETPDYSGISHFIEHMVFKGTETRSAFEIADEADSIGGHINAFTGNEHTCFHATALDTHIIKAADILCDMLLKPRFDRSDIVLERGVVAEEIDMYRDSPEDFVVDKLWENAFADCTLGMPILGTKRNLKRFSSDTLHEYMKKNYTGAAVLVAISGSFPDELIDFLSERLSNLPSGDAPVSGKAVYTPCVTLARKTTEQNQIAFAFPTGGASDEKRYAVRLLNMIIGGGMSSVLFQKIREELGLCYSISSFTNTFADIGVLAIVIALNRDMEKRALTEIFKQLDEIRHGKITEKRLRRAAEQYKAGLLMSLESTSARMNNLAAGMLRHGRIISVDEAIESIDAVGISDLNAIACKLLDTKEIALSVAGTPLSRESYKKIFKNSCILNENIV